MDQLTNPFAVLTFIAAPAILTNASSVMALGTVNRFARAVDRVRALAKELHSREQMAQVAIRLRVRQLHGAERRVQILVRTLTCFYASLGSFAAACFASLLGASFVMTGHTLGRQLALVAALVCGSVGIGGLVTGSALLVWESRFTMRLLSEEAELIVEELHLEGVPIRDAAK